jgi:hypothetical protein
MKDNSLELYLATAYNKVQAQHQLGSGAAPTLYILNKLSRLYNTFQRCLQQI